MKRPVVTITDESSGRVLATTQYADVAEILANALVPSRSESVIVARTDGFRYRVCRRPRSVQATVRLDIPTGGAV